MLDISKFSFRVDDSGDVYASSELEDWDASNFRWDLESGQLIFIDIPKKTFSYSPSAKIYTINITKGN